MCDDGREHIYKYFKANITYIYILKIFYGDLEGEEGEEGISMDL